MLFEARQSSFCILSRSWGVKLHINSGCNFKVISWISRWLKRINVGFSERGNEEYPLTPRYPNVVSIGLLSYDNTRFINHHFNFCRVQEVVSHLEVFRFCGNRLTQVPAWFHGLKNLTILDFTTNALTSLPTNLLPSCPKLRELNLSHNRLVVTPNRHSDIIL